MESLANPGGTCKAELGWSSGLGLSCARRGRGVLGRECVTWGGLRGSWALTLGASQKRSVLCWGRRSLCWPTRLTGAIVETRCLNMRDYTFPAVSATLRRVQTLQGPCSLVGYSLASPARNGRACRGESRAVQVSERDEKKNRTENEKPYRTDVEPELYTPAVCWNSLKLDEWQSFWWNGLRWKLCISGSADEGLEVSWWRSGFQVTLVWVSTTVPFAVFLFFFFFFLSWH